MPDLTQAPNDLAVVSTTLPADKLDAGAAEGGKAAPPPAGKKPGTKPKKKAQPNKGLSNAQIEYLD